MGFYSNEYDFFFVVGVYYASAYFDCAKFLPGHWGIIGFLYRRITMAIAMLKESYSDLDGAITFYLDGYSPSFYWHKFRLTEG